MRAIEVNNNNNVKKKKNGISKDDKTQIESFSRVLSDMLSSLKVKHYSTLFFVFLILVFFFFFLICFALIVVVGPQISNCTSHGRRDRFIR